MKKSTSSRRNFIKNISIAGIALGNSGSLAHLFEENIPPKKRVGIIGLDTSHCIEFTKLLNNANAGPEFAGYKVTYAFPKGSDDIESSVTRIPGYIDEIKKFGVKIAESIKELLDNVDVVLLETNDGKPRLK